MKTNSENDYRSNPAPLYYDASTGEQFISVPDASLTEDQVNAVKVSLRTYEVVQRENGEDMDPSLASLARLRDQVEQDTSIPPEEKDRVWSQIIGPDIMYQSGLNGLKGIQEDREELERLNRELAESKQRLRSAPEQLSTAIQQVNRIVKNFQERAGDFIETHGTGSEIERQEALLEQSREEDPQGNLSDLYEGQRKVVEQGRSALEQLRNSFTDEINHIVSHLPSHLQKVIMQEKLGEALDAVLYPGGSKFLERETNQGKETTEGADTSDDPFSVNEWTDSGPYASLQNTVDRLQNAVSIQRAFYVSTMEKRLEPSDPRWSTTQGNWDYERWPLHPQRVNARQLEQRPAGEDRNHHKLQAEVLPKKVGEAALSLFQKTPDDPLAQSIILTMDAAAMPPPSDLGKAAYPYELPEARLLFPVGRMKQRLNEVIDRLNYRAPAINGSKLDQPIEHQPPFAFTAGGHVTIYDDGRSAQLVRVTNDGTPPVSAYFVFTGEEGDPQIVGDEEVTAESVLRLVSSGVPNALRDMLNDPLSHTSRDFLDKQSLGDGNKQQGEAIAAIDQHLSREVILDPNNPSSTVERGIVPALLRADHSSYVENLGNMAAFVGPTEDMQLVEAAQNYKHGKRANRPNLEEPLTNQPGRYGRDPSTKQAHLFLSTTKKLGEIIFEQGNNPTTKQPLPENWQPIAAQKRWEQIYGPHAARLQLTDGREAVFSARKKNQKKMTPSEIADHLSKLGEENPNPPQVETEIHVPEDPGSHAVQFSQLDAFKATVRAAADLHTTVVQAGADKYRADTDERIAQMQTEAYVKGEQIKASANPKVIIATMFGR